MTRPSKPPAPALLPTEETLVEPPTGARLLRRSMVEVNAAIDSGRVKLVTHLGRKFICLEALEAVLAAEAGEGRA